MKMENLQLTPQKFQGSQETTMNKYMPIKWTTWKKWTNSQKVKSPQTEPGRNRKYKQTDHKH